MKPLSGLVLAGYLRLSITCAYNVCMNTHTNSTDFTTYKGVTIFNVRNASTGGNKVQIRDIAVTYIADKWCDAGDAYRSSSNIKRAHAMIDWLLANGAPVVDGRIVTTMGDFDTCEFGCQARNIDGYWIFMKAGK
jgi:hypothetical protein